MSNQKYVKGEFVNSDLGKRKIDSEGAPVSGSRMDVSRAYAGVPGLLQKVIDEGDEAAWNEILGKIDYIYANLDASLGGLDRETGFATEVQKQVRSGKKLLFKPNLVGPTVIDNVTHGEGLGAPICTEWTLIAALMRWFHDTLAVSYHQMALGDASASAPITSMTFSSSAGKPVSIEAVFEGKCDDFYGGWGFFFVRRYLSERHPPSHTDDPMSGYEDSVAGRFLPPGIAEDRLMVYDLNKLYDDASKGRTIAVPEGAIYKEITLHKAIIGGDPDNQDDVRAYPGCVLINVPKLKLHAQDMITNATKNLGIGLYPLQAPANGEGDSSTQWKYTSPFPVPVLKAELPHMPWVVKLDDATDLPVKDENGAYIATKTAGMKGTQADVIRAAQAQNVYMVHITDGIDMININHDPVGLAVRIPEGYVWSSLDCIALDLFCARYCFKTVGMREGLKLKEEHGWPTEFVHNVPVAHVEGGQITTGEGLDSPLFRYPLYRYAEERGVGQQNYYVVGWDSVTETPMASLAGHLGRLENGEFKELMTTTMYHNPTCMLWDMQKTVLSYAEAHDSLTGSSLVKEFMDGFDENEDGIIDYDENGRKGFWSPAFRILNHVYYLQIADTYGALRGPFKNGADFLLKHTNSDWNPQGHDFAREYSLMWTATRAYEMSQSEAVSADPFVPGMTWGRGRWPSWQLATYMRITGTIYGAQSLENINLLSLYGVAFQYANKTLNGGSYAGSSDLISEQNSLNAYIHATMNGADPLDFTLYVPEGYGSVGSVPIPNVEETGDPKKIFTAHFNNGAEIW
ncbi:MAG: DUF362 domain-containing protein [Euryarchaeota archaeon]